MPSQHDKGAAFRDWHEKGDIFTMPNSLDAVSACIMANQGFSALASGGWAVSLMAGKMDGGGLSLEEAAWHTEQIAATVNVPVSADFENGYGHSPEDCAWAVHRVTEARCVSCSIEDYTADPAAPAEPPLQVTGASQIMVPAEGFEPPTP